MNKTVIVLDSSRIKTHLECPEKFNISYRQHRRKTWVTSQWKKDYSSQGTYVHTLLETYYNLRALNPKMNSLEHGTAALNLFQSLKLAPKMKLPPEFETLVNVRFMQYVIKNSLGDYNPLVRNGVPAHEVRFSIKLYEDESVIFILEGRIDLLCTVGIQGNTVKAFIDHKTQERTSEMYEWTPQTLSYALATGFNYGGFNYFGLQQKYDEKTTLHRDFFFIPDWKIAHWKKYIIEEVYWRVYKETKNTDVHESFTGKDDYIWPQNWLTCAGPDLKRACEFSEVCNAETPELRQLIKRQFTHVVPAWSPWNE